jgi:serine/threonine protein kinase
VSLARGTRIGPYEVVTKLGEGGMGAVYRARDPRLRLDAAVKVLPDLVASDPERLARFEREGQAPAALASSNASPTGRACRRALR